MGQNFLTRLIRSTTRLLCKTYLRDFMTDRLTLVMGLYLTFYTIKLRYCHNVEVMEKTKGFYVVVFLCYVWSPEY